MALKTAALPDEIQPKEYKLVELDITLHFELLNALWAPDQDVPSTRISLRRTTRLDA